MFVYTSTELNCYNNVYGHKYNDQKLYEVYICLYMSFFITSVLNIIYQILLLTVD
jgi:hypothetical protein